MGHMRKRGQGTRRVFGAVVTGNSYPVPAGGSGEPPPASSVDQATALLEAGGPGAGSEGDPPADDGGSEGASEVQPSTEGGETQPTGQDLIAPYLEGLDGDTRSIVEERLKRFQGDTDSHANRKIQDLSEKLSGFQRFAEEPEALEPILDLYAWLMQEPKEALPWIVEALHNEQRVELDELRDPLLEKLGIQQPPSGGRQDPQQGQQGQQTPEEVRPVTRDDLQEFFNEQREREEQERAKEKERENAAEQLNGWVDGALDKFKLKERIPEDSPMRQFIFQQAHQLMQSGKVRNGRVAIESAVESVAQFLGTQTVKGSDNPSANGDGSGAPRTANGGTGAQVPDTVDLGDKKSRVDYAASLLAGSRSAEE